MINVFSVQTDVCLRLISRSTVDGTRLRCHSRSWRSSVCQDFSGFPRWCWKRVSRTHSSGSRRSNDDVRSIAIQYRYLRSFRREPGKHVSASYVFHALEHPDIYRIHDLVSHPPVLYSPRSLRDPRLPSHPETQCIPFVLFERNSWQY